uniref:DNA pilot protein n=1 Tax=Dulem virus 240 TaxID=3145717 RepID=A0AAU8B5V2_9VIRU
MATVQNPYRNPSEGGVNPLQSLSSWNRLTDWLGFTNHTGQALYQQQQSAANWEAQYQLAMDDRQYNSESATAARQRAAGINPDLAGLSADPTSGTASSVDSGEVPTQENLADSSPAAFFQTIGNVLTSALGMYKGITDIQNTRLDSDLALLNQQGSDMKNSLIEMEAAEILGSGTDGELDIAGVLDRMKNFSRSDRGYNYLNILNSKLGPFKTKRGRSYAVNQLRQYLDSDQFRSDVFSRASGTAAKEISSTRGITDYNAFGSQDEVGRVLSVISEAALGTFEESSKGDYYKAKNDRVYNENYDAATAATADNTANEARQASDEGNLNMKSVQRDILKGLAKEAKNGNTFAAIAIVLISAASNFSSASFGKTASSNPTLGTRQTSNFSVGF